ncbi:MAG: GGDEF domain-containing protein [Gammaproteobacteria bacterium]|nr:GGDEF domain-containing protein [Gammaproteobacteria bacterium]
MDSQTQYDSVNRKKDAMPDMPKIQYDADVIDELGPKRLELASILQKTLELEELINLFAQELGRHIPFDGLTYSFSPLDIKIELGRITQHNCSYELLITEENQGHINLHRDSQFQERELATAENMLAGLLYPLRNTLLYQLALQSATTDPLTGVKNRAAMDTSIKREIRLARRQNSPLSFILLDLDHFKSVNDQFGHLIGDQVLREVAKVAEETIRDSDIIFRYGGEEFLVLLSGTRISGATLLAERIRNNIENLRLFPDLKMRVTASMGVVSMIKDEDAESLFKRADSALYSAKNRGRNQVVIDDSV